MAAASRNDGRRIPHAAATDIIKHNPCFESPRKKKECFPSPSPIRSASDSCAELNRCTHATSRPNGGLVSAPVARQNPNPIDRLAQILTALFVSLSFSQMAIAGQPPRDLQPFWCHTIWVFLQPPS